MTKQIGDKGPVGSESYKRWEKVHNLFPPEIHGVEYWGDMYQLATKSLSPEAKKFYKDEEIWDEWPLFKNGDEPFQKQHVEAFRDCKWNLKDEEQYKGQHCNKMSW